MARSLDEIDTPDALFDYVDAARELVQGQDQGRGLAPNGFLGLFVRRAVLAFDRMNFAQVSRLFHKLQKYVSKGKMVTAGAVDTPAPRSPSSGIPNRLMGTEASSDTHGHFASYQRAIRSQHFTDALHSLHRFFDLRPVAAAAETRVQFHYASLSLAALHYHFGHVDEALLAVHEAVRIAQENADSGCLQHALVGSSLWRRSKKRTSAQTSEK